MTSSYSSARLMGGSTSQSAARFLILLDKLGTPISGTPALPTAVRQLSSLTKLEKLDFWVRNPDYLAGELLTEYEEGNRTAAEVGPHVLRMLTGAAPSLHAYRMSRHLYGAYERVDNPMAILKSYGHVAHRRLDDSNPKSRRDYFLLERGAAALDRLRIEVPSLSWYDDQAAAILLLSDISTGAETRRRQYLQPEYKGTSNGDVIPDIIDRVRVRAVSLGFGAGIL